MRRAAAVAIVVAGAAAVSIWLWDDPEPVRHASCSSDEQAGETEPFELKPVEGHARTAKRPVESDGEESSETRRNVTGIADAERESDWLLEARKWFEKRRAAKDAEDEKAEEQARAEWGVTRRRLISTLRADEREAKRFLAWLGRLDDEEMALYLARVLPFIFTDGFEEHLIATATGRGSVQLRRAALVGLRARGLNAAVATGKVAARAKEPVLRAAATEELALHVPDPAVISKSRELIDIAAVHLGDEEPNVRRAALYTLLAARRPLSPEHKRAVEALLQDPDEGIRPLAKVLLRR